MNNMGNDFLIKKFLAQQRQELWWRNVRYGITIILIISTYFFYNHYFFSKNKSIAPYVNVVELEGTIEPDGQASAKNINELLATAFEDTYAKGVILKINSLGGTPAQSSIIYEGIKDLRRRFPTKKFIVVAEDYLTSGAYLVALAADKIYINANSLVGSIGVVSRGFGAVDFIHNIGIERRTLTAGINKDIGDPFLPWSDKDKKKIQIQLNDLQVNFIELVKHSRNRTIKPENYSKIFSADTWIGKKAVTLGLVDGIKDLNAVLHTEFGVYNYKICEKLTPITEKILSGFQKGLTASIKNLATQSFTLS
jgi:protease-4